MEKAIEKIKEVLEYEQQFSKAFFKREQHFIALVAKEPDNETHKSNLTTIQDAYLNSLETVRQLEKAIKVLNSVNILENYGKEG